MKCHQLLAMKAPVVFNQKSLFYCDFEVDISGPIEINLLLFFCLLVLNNLNTDKICIMNLQNIHVLKNA